METSWSKIILYGTIIGSCIIIMFFPEIFENIHTQIKGEEDKNEDSFSKKLKDLIPTKYKIIATLLITFSTICFWIYRIFSSRKYLQNKSRSDSSYNRVPMFVSNRSSTKREYENETKQTTLNELEKLRKNPKFIEMYNQKGPNPDNWNWQSAQKKNKTVWRENEDNESINSEEMMNI